MPCCDSPPTLLVPEIREVMDIRQASDYLGISPDTLYKYASEDFVPAMQAGQPRWRASARASTSGWTAKATSTAAEAELDPRQKKPSAPPCKDS